MQRLVAKHYLRTKINYKRWRMSNYHVAGEILCKLTMSEWTEGVGEFYVLHVSAHHINDYRL